MKKLRHCHLVYSNITLSDLHIETPNVFNFTDNFSGPDSRTAIHRLRVCVCVCVCVSMCPENIFRTK